MPFCWRSKVGSGKQLCCLPGADAGIALIEVMFATGIMALTLAMVFGSVISLNDLSSVSSTRRVVSSHLTGVLEQLRTSSYDEVLSFTPTASDASETVTAVCADARGESVALPVNVQSLTEPLPNPLEVRVTVTRNDAKGHPLAVSGSVLIAR